ncbi:hypothetical protein CapIbe_021632 [Capra ibex]
MRVCEDRQIAGLEGRTEDTCHRGGTRKAGHSESWLIAKRLDFKVGGVNETPFLMNTDEVSVCHFQSTTLAPR